MVLEGQQDAFQTGIDMLSKLSPNLHLSVGAQESSQIAETKNCTIHRVKGPHPAGNVGVQIHHIDPINARNSVGCYMKMLPTSGDFFKQVFLMLLEPWQL